MATWLAHLRIADALLDIVDEEDRVAFVVGNLGPDSGVPNEDWSAFTPSTRLSHWRDPVTEEIDHERFFAEHLADCGTAFHLGYYVHLLSDYWWGQFVYLPKAEKYRAEMEADPKFIWTMKKNWYDLDHKYLQDNKDFRAYAILGSIEAVDNGFLDLFTKDAFTKSLARIKDFYGRGKDLEGREFEYLTEAEMDDYMREASRLIVDKLSERTMTRSSRSLPSKYSTITSMY